MTETNKNDWSIWLEQRAAAAPDPMAVDRAKQAMLAIHNDSPAQRSVSVGGWHSRLQQMSERVWGRVALCGVALMLGMTPYVGALLVLNR